MSAASNDASAPVVGIWKRMPVVGTDHRAVLRTSYIFTERALSERTVFSALQNIGSSYSVICCLEVSNITPLDLKAITTKYKKRR